MMKKTICRILTGTAMFVWMMVIFFFSAQPAKESSEVSGTLAYRIVMLADETFDWGLNGPQKENYAESMQPPLRKAAHMTEFAVLCLLGFVFLKSMGIRGKRLYAFSFGLTTIYAASDEIHQFFVAGRSCSFLDVVIDASGAGIAILLLGLFCAASRLHGDRNKIRKR